MHPYLRTTIEAFAGHFREDARCVGLHLKGSGGTGTDDDSDVDLELVVQDAHYATVAAELRRFGQDGRAACDRWGRSYPEALKQYVLRHLRSMRAIRNLDAE